MKFKRILAAVTLMASMTMFAGCGQGAGTADSGSTSGSTEKTDLASDGIVDYKATDMSQNPAQAKNRKDTLVIGTEAPNGVFFYPYAPGIYDQDISETMFAHLTYNDEKGNVTPGLADLPEISEDKLTYTYKIKDEANWSDGTPITAKDVLLMIKIMCDGTYDGEVDIVTGGITVKGSKEYQAGTASDISGVKIIDDKTIAITLEQPSSSAEYDLSDIVPMQEAYYGKYYSQGNTERLKETFTNPGPASASYKFVSYKPGEEIVLEANDKSMFGAPKVPNLIFKVTTEDTRMSMLQSGDIDFDKVATTEDNVDTAETLGYLNYKMFPECGYGLINLNFDRPVFKDKAVRQALTYGLDRQKITDTVYGKYAQVINVSQAKASWAYSEPDNKYEFDIEKAKKILDDAGWKEGSDGIREKDGVKLAVHYTGTTGSKTAQAILAVAPENWKQLGVDFSSDIVDFATLRNKMKGSDWDMCSLGWSLTPNPNDATIFKTGGAQNDGKYSNAKVDELYDKIKLETDKDKLKALYAQLYKEINEDLPYIFLNQSEDLYVYNGRLKGLEFSPYVRYSRDLYKVSIED